MERGSRKQSTNEEVGGGERLGEEDGSASEYSGEAKVVKLPKVRPGNKGSHSHHYGREENR